MAKKWLSVVVVAATMALVAPSAATAAADYEFDRVLFTFRDTAITESSGVVASSVRDDVFFTHNDSGDSARFFAVDDRGCTLTEYELPGVAANDIEDIARGPDPVTGKSVIWLADIGNNFPFHRPTMTLYKVAEPNVNNSSRRSDDDCPPRTIESVPSTTYIVAYDDMEHDAETLLADPADGRVYVVSKSPFGNAGLYAAPPVLAPAPAVNTLTHETTFVVEPTPTYDNDPTTYVPGILGSTVDRPYAQPAFDVQGRLSVVGGDIAADRSRVVLRTYTDAFEWDLGDQPLSVVLTGVALDSFAVEYQRQGEAIAYTRDGASIVTTCEDVGCPAHLYRPLAA